MKGLKEKKEKMAKKMGLKKDVYQTLISKSPVKASDLSKERAYHIKSYENKRG